ncbi:MAG: type VI secretion system baseplate subunit TssG [Pseudomonadota bacterium]|nr:type VI secretion system baseplate subunit TssG [Pseudomonadota bacterium]
MAAKGRRSTPPLIEELRNRPYRFDFYQAVRLVELAHGVGVDPSSGKIPLGEGPDPRKEAVRFTADPSLAFPPSAIKDYVPRDHGKPDDMTIRFLGLAGAMGPLPRPFTERLIRRISKKDTAWRAFLDIFNHRLASLMVRVRKAHRIGLDTHPPHETLIAKLLRSFIGLGTRGLRDRMAIDDRALLRYAGLLAHRQRTAVGLERMMQDYYGLPVKAQQFIGEWVSLEAGQETVLGGKAQGLSGRNNALGTQAFLGTRYWDQQSGLELRIGPLDRETFESFLPGGHRYRPLLALVMFYVSPEYNFTARLIAAPEAVPASRLGGDLRLGWTSWLRSADSDETDSQVSIRIRSKHALETT